MNPTVAVLALAVAFQSGAPPQTTSSAEDSITEGLPAQVVAELAQRALHAPEDEQNWAELAMIAETSVPGTSEGVTVAGTAAIAYSFGKDRDESAADWVSRSATANPRTWVGVVAFLTVLLVGLRSRRDGRHVARGVPAGKHKSLVWGVRQLPWRAARRRIGVPQADYLLGRGLPAREVARQTGLSLDLVRLVHFRSGGLEGAPSVLHPESPAARQGGSSVGGSFARSADHMAAERTASNVSVIA